MNTILCPCQKNSNVDSKTIQCPTCFTFQHESCIRDASKMKNYQCPYCQVKLSDFFIKTLHNILCPTLIQHEDSDTKSQISFTFNLEAFKKFPPKGDNIRYIMIRSLRLDEDGYEHHWPYNFTIWLNGVFLKTFSLPKYPVRSKLRVDYPITFFFKDEDIAPKTNYHFLNKEYFFPQVKFFQTNSTGKNVLEMKTEWTKNDNDKFSYVITIDYVEVFKEMTEAISYIPLINDTRKLKAHIKKNSTQHDDICSSEKISLLDCYTRCNRINLPARSINCSHMSVFDLLTYLTLNRKNKVYDCPLCRKKGTRVYIDGMIMKLIKENKNIDQVILSQDYEIQSMTASEEGSKCDDEPSHCEGGRSMEEKKAKKILQETTVNLYEDEDEDKGNPANESKIKLVSSPQALNPYPEFAHKDVNKDIKNNNNELKHQTISSLTIEKITRRNKAFQVMTTKNTALIPDNPMSINTFTITCPSNNSISK